MNINTQNSILIPYLGIKTATNETNNINVYSSEPENTIQDNNNNNTDIWNELSSKYNIRSASFDELCEISSKLYQSGQITLLDHMLLTFDPTKLYQQIKSNITPAIYNGKTKTDWVAEYEARSEYDLKMGNMMGNKNNKNILNILIHLQKQSSN